MNNVCEVYVPKDNVNDEFATIVRIYVKNGARIEKGGPLLDFETSKTVVPIEAEKAGFVELLCRERDKVEIGTLILRIHDSEIQNLPLTDGSLKNTFSDDKEKLETKYSERAKTLMNQHNVSHEVFKGRDFVTGKDVLKLLGLHMRTNEKISPKTMRSKGLNAILESDQVEVEGISNAKKLEIAYLSDASSGLMTSTVNISVDVGEKRLYRPKIKIFEDSNLPLIIYETAKLLKKYKDFNAFYVDENIACYKNINIGIAVDINDGLKILTIPNADKLDINGIEDCIYKLIEKYLDKTLAVCDLTGSTFTITDLSSSQIDFFTPIINFRQAAILGVSKTDKKLERFFLTLTFDHRITEGKKAGEFLFDIKSRLESYNSDSTDSVVKAFYAVKCSICLKSLEEDKEMEGKGMIPVIDHDGLERYVCHVCLKGF